MAEREEAHPNLTDRQVDQLLHDAAQRERSLVLNGMPCPQARELANAELFEATRGRAMRSTGPYRRAGSSSTLGSGEPAPQSSGGVSSSPVSVGFRPPEPPREPIRPQQLRLLWRMQGPQRVVAAALYQHPGGTELRVYFEPEERDDLLQSEVNRFDAGALETKAETLRGILREKGWWELTNNG